VGCRESPAPAPPRTHDALEQARVSCGGATEDSRRALPQPAQGRPPGPGPSAPGARPFLPTRVDHAAVAPQVFDQGVARRWYRSPSSLIRGWACTRRMFSSPQHAGRVLGATRHVLSHCRRNRSCPLPRRKVSGAEEILVHWTRSHPDVGQVRTEYNPAVHLRLSGG